MGKKSTHKWKIAIRPTEGQEARKITKIIGLNGDGFSVVTPYHKARSGFLFKHLMDLQTLGVRRIPWEECVGFTADDRAKLSYHVDGFTQFSSENPGKIISGRDEKTGEPKGLGILVRSLKTPSVSGPSVGITVWGIEEFELLGTDENAIIFQPSDCYYRKSSPENANCWHLAIYAFAAGCVPPVRFRGKDAVMEFTPHPISGGIAGSVVELKTIYLEKEEVYLGLHIERTVGHFPVSSGWSMNGPGNYTQYQSGYVLQGIYPREVIPVTGRPSLNRLESPPAESAKS
ncbi:MAG TPA: hypothetical protein VEI26_02505 [Terriglobales bacterium]|nr:hypothetical protein [Terriglobales bacterium]